MKISVTKDQMTALLDGRMCILKSTLDAWADLDKGKMELVHASRPAPVKVLIVGTKLPSSGKDGLISFQVVSIERLAQ